MKITKRLMRRYAAALVAEARQHPERHAVSYEGFLRWRRSNSSKSLPEAKGLCESQPSTLSDATSATEDQPSLVDVQQDAKVVYIDVGGRQVAIWRHKFEELFPGIEPQKFNEAMQSSQAVREAYVTYILDTLRVQARLLPPQGSSRDDGTEPSLKSLPKTKPVDLVPKSTERDKPSSLKRKR